MVVLKVKQLALDRTESDSEYTLVLDMNALAKVKKETDLDLMDRDKWVWADLNALQVTTILWCALSRFHPEVTLEQARAMIPPAEVWKLRSVLLELCFPGALERLQKAQAEAKQADSPNPPPATS
jgi:hypothetical protein